MSKHIAAIYYSFPIQLVVLHIRKNKALLLFWLILFGIITKQVGRLFGIPYLFLDPEYVNRVDFWSFYIMGISLGCFTMAFHISCYILDHNKFGFLGNLPKPFTRFCINNSLIPFCFMLVYIYQLVSFQLANERLLNQEIIFDAAGLVFGYVTMILVLFYYLVLTNHDIIKVLASQVNRTLQRKKLSRVNVLHRIQEAKLDIIRVDNYFETLLRLREVDDTMPIDNRAIIKIFDQNQFNAIIIELVVVIAVLVLGFFRGHTFFQIPAGASLVLLFTMFVMMGGAFFHWLKDWSTTTVVGMVLIINFLMTTPFFKSDYEAYGLDYTGPRAAYSLENLRSLDGNPRYLADKAQTVEILKNWRAKFPANKKPKMVFICTSGGGQRAAVWTMRSLQMADNQLGGKLMQHTCLMTGASGGLVGSSFFRELYLRKMQGDSIDIYSDRYLYDIAKDNLNAIVFSLVVNDIFFRFQRFDYQGHSYYRDRGYAFEEQLNQNTDGLLDKPLARYRDPERKGQIPMLIMSPTIINDGRRLYISPQNISYMTTQRAEAKQLRNQTVHGIEFRRMFEEQGADSLRFLSALRMSATFPYITPNVTLPSTPAMEIMDAGLSDNFGITDAVRFLYVFKDWISENTSGVVFVAIRDSQKNGAIEQNEEQSLFQKVFTPIGSLYANWENLQDINNDNAVEFAQGWFKGDIERIELQYVPRSSYWKLSPDAKTIAKNSSPKSKTEGASLSWHLTEPEKENIKNAIYEVRNQNAIYHLARLLK